MIRRLIILLLIVGCEEETKHDVQGGIAITFDDRNINNWYSYRNYYWENNIKSTFFLSQIHEYTNDEINMLIELKNDGHELGYHGTHHINANDYLQNHTVQNYLDYEIFPDLDICDSIFGYPTSFAYPYGVRNNSLDSALSNYFQILRSTAYGNLAPNNNIKELDKIFVNISEINTLVYGVGIDSIYNNSINSIQEGINRAYANDEIIILYLHNIDGNESYHINFEVFDQIIYYVRKLNMPFLTISGINQ